MALQKHPPPLAHRIFKLRCDRLLGAAVLHAIDPVSLDQGAPHLDFAGLCDRNLPYRGSLCNAEAIQFHLGDIAAKVTPRAYAILIFDQAGWHGAKSLKTPSNISLMPLLLRRMTLDAATTAIGDLVLGERGHEDRHRADARRPPSSARSRCPTPLKAGRDGGVLMASSSATAAADRLDPIGGGGAEPGLRRSDGRTMGLTGLHVQPRLAVGDVSARRALISYTKLLTFPRTSPRTGQPYPWIVRSTAMVNHYYIYAVDRDFDPFFLKFCSYFPFNAKLCLNGYEYAKRQLARKGIASRRSTTAS